MYCITTNLFKQFRFISNSLQDQLQFNFDLAKDCSKSPFTSAPTNKVLLELLQAIDWIRTVDRDTSSLVTTSPIVTL